jgi:hypothetical protein
MEPIYGIDIGGGLGDCIWDYLMNKPFRVLTDFSKKHKVKICCYVHSHNEHSMELLRHNRHIDEILIERYGSTTPRAIPGLENSFDLNQYVEEMMPIYLSTPEKQLVDSVAKAGPFAVVHPFAGEKRRCMGSHLHRVLAALTSRGLRTLVVGATHSRGEERLIERCEVDMHGAINLVNKSNIRVCCELIRRAKCFVGTHSACQMAAWAYRTPSLTVIPDELTTYLIPADGHYPNENPYITEMFKRGNGVLFHSQMPHIQKFVDEMLTRLPWA